MRPWLSGIMSPCQGLVGVSITPGRTHSKRLPSREPFAMCAARVKRLRALRG